MDSRLRLEGKMKRILDGRSHAALDYACAAVFAGAPFLLKTAPGTAKICYALAGIVVCLALFTRYPGGIIKRVPFSYHALIEFYAAFALAAYGLFFQRGVDRVFFVAAGMCVLAIFLMTDFSERAQTRLRSRRS